MALRHVILAALYQGNLTGYEITKEFDEVLGFFWQASHQQVYRDLKRLEADGCVHFTEVRQEAKPDKKVYELTSSGRDELLHWLRAPTRPRSRNDELLVKFFAGELLGLGGLAAEMHRQRQAHEGLLDSYRAIEQEHFAGGNVDPLPRLYRLIYLTLRRGILAEEAWLEWAAEVDELLGRMRTEPEGGGEAANPAS